MANTVFKLRRSSVAGKVPNTSTLSIGELALNLTDRKLYSSDGTDVWETGANLTTLTVSTNTNVNNVIFPINGGIYANGSFGLDTQVLKSNGSAIYWGTGGSGGGSIQVVKQQYVGDGTTTTFPVTGGYDSNTLFVYVNGVMLRKGVEVDVISGTDFTIYSPPPNGAFIDVFGTGLTIANGFSTTVSQQFTANGNSNTFTVASGFIPTTLQVYLNGVKQIPAVDYTTAGGNTVNFFTTPPNNYIVDVFAYQTTVIQSAPVRQSNTADGTSVNYVISGGYIPGQLDVYMNGVKLNPSQANVASGYNVSFDTAPPAGAELSFVGFVPTNYFGVNTSASYVWSNTQTFANVFIIGSAGINANNSYGDAGQVLTSNGTSVYWSNSATFVRETFTGTGACTTFQVTGGYTPYNLDVYVTGVKQLSNTDVVISSGNNIVFTVPPANNASIEVVGVVPLTYSYANQSYDYIWTGKHTYGNSTVNTTVNSSLISIGNTTVNTQIVAGNVYLNGSTLLIGNSTSNVVISGTTITVSNSTSNVTFGSGPATINAISTNTFTVGTAAYHAANGNFGIGTSTPAYKLQVSDTIMVGGELQSNTTSPALRLFSGGSEKGKVSANSSGYLLLDTVGSQRMSIDPNGNTAIGTGVASNGRLEVHNNGTNFVWARNSAAGGGISGFVCQNSGDTRGIRIDGSNFQVYDHSAGATRMQIDGSGRVTKPNQPFGFVTYSGLLGRGNYIVFNSINQSGTDYSTSTGRMTAPVAGAYQFNCTVRTTGAAGSNFTISFVVNGNFIIDLWGYDTSGGRRYGGTLSTIRYLSAGDYVQFYWNHDTAGNTLDAAWMSYELLS